VRRHAKALIAALTLLICLGSAPAAFAAPTVTIDPVGSHSITTAQVSGSISTDADVGETYYYFHYRPVGSADWSQANTQGPLGAASGPTPVFDTLTNLKAATEYEVRLTAWPFSDFVEVYSPEPNPTFTTDPAPNAPTLSVDPATGVGFTKAHISGTVDPEGGNVDPVSGPIPIFWELQVNREGEGWSGVASGEISASEPEGGGPIPATSSDPIPVEADLTDLQPGSNYKFRLKATYAGTEAFSSEDEFETGAVAAPVVTIDDAFQLTGTSAHFSGTVEVANADEAFDASCRFEYVTQKAFEDAGDAFPEGAPSVACDPATVSGEAPQPVEVQADVTNLEPNTLYHLRLLAQNKGGTTIEVASDFQSPAIAPSVLTGTNTPHSPGTTLVRGYITPHNSAITECRFEYGPTASYGQSAPCEQVPTTNNEAQQVTAQIAGLQPGEAYHFRIVATSTAGTTQSPDSVFGTSIPVQPSAPGSLPGQGFLPHDRAWEMVSPPDKNGSNVAVIPTRTRPSTDGSAVGYSARGAFAGAEGTGVLNDYVAMRSSDPDPGHGGWSTHPVTPRLGGLTFLNAATVEPRYVGDFSGDLSRGIYVSHTPLTDDPWVSQTLNLYRRTNLRQPGPGSYDLLTPCPLCAETQTPLPTPTDSNAVGRANPELAGVSPDLERIAFESPQPLTADVAGVERRHVYEWDRGALRHSGRIPSFPASSCDDSAGPACEAAETSIAGQGTGSEGSGSLTHLMSLTPHVLSDGSDGHSRVFFTVPDGNGSFAGRIYMRVDGHETVQLNAPEVDGSDEASARFLDASADGRRAFFSTTQRLNEDAPVNEIKLYMYDASKPASDPHNLTLVNVDREPKDGLTIFKGVIGLSDDGHSVYLLSSGQLVTGGPAVGADSGVYLWRDGSLTYVGSIGRDDGVFASHEQLVTSGTNLRLNVREARVSPDGGHLLFSTRKGVDLTGYDHGSCNFGCREFYVYSAVDHTLQCASCRPDGAAASVDATTGPDAFRGGGAKPDKHMSRALSDDGRFVFFSTSERLVSADTNGVEDAYLFDAETGQPHLLSNGRDKKPSYFLDATPDGSDVFITTQQPLSGWDVDGSNDLYDARVGGGFPEPPLPTASCSGDSCQPPPARIDDPTPSSATFQGAGNARARGKARCPRGRRAVRRAGKRRCVKKAQKRNRRPGKRTAGNERRVGR
jgi:hypothetical protein